MSVAAVKTFLANIGSEVAATAAVAGTLWLWKRLGRLRAHQMSPWRNLVVGGSVAAIGAGYWWLSSAPRVWVICVTAGVPLFFWGLDVRQYRRVGLLGVDPTPPTGLDYAAALAMCTDGLDFLGIGAHKLSSQRRAFEGAMDRCHRENRPIRFLLCHPDNPALEDMALRAGKGPAAYKTLVEESLAVLRHQRRALRRNVEVRLYRSPPPLFRLMFINEDLLLAGHYVLGRGDGSDLPQLRIGRAVHGQPDDMGLYYPLRQYFEELWSDAEVHRDE